MMNFNCYSKDINGHYVSANQAFLDFTRISHINDLLGNTDHDMPWNTVAAHIRENDAKVIACGTSFVFIEKPIINGKLYFRRCHKSPLLGHSDKIIGMMGMSFTIEERVAIPLSPQQNACLKELALGSSNKLIAKKLGLSPRTVEHYLNAIRIKLECDSRSDLIIQAIARGLVNPIG